MMVVCCWQLAFSGPTTSLSQLIFKERFGLVASEGRQNNLLYQIWAGITIGDMDQPNILVNLTDHLWLVLWEEPM